MQFSELIDKRRSTRRFTDRKVENDTLRRIMEQALKAPSAKNTRSTRLMAVTDPASSPLWQINAAITATMLQLAAVDSDLSSCWVHVGDYHRIGDDPASQRTDDYLKELLPVPPAYGILCVVALGYADYTPKPLPPYEGDERILFA